LQKTGDARIITGFALQLPCELNLKQIRRAFAHVFAKLNKSFKSMKMPRHLPSTLRIAMRVSLYQLIIAFIFAGITLAKDARSQDMLNQNITINARNETVKEVLKQIYKQTSVRFTYNATLSLGDKKVTVSAVNKPLYLVLDEILIPLKISYVVQNKLILLKQADLDKTRPGTSEPTGLRTIHGKVSQQDAGPLPGVSVIVKGTQRGTVTNENGEFDIEIQAGDSILVFSFVGYKTTEQNISEQQQMMVELVAEDRSLNEVVVVGYGTQKVSDLTGSVTRVSEKDLQSRPVPSFQDAIQGRSSGVYVRQTGGNLDGRFAVSIRGTGSVTGSNEPLVVVDGVPLFSGGLSTINPKDIIAVDILKDASATAIYGARAANGVLLVSTRRGKEGKTRITLNADIGWEKMSNQYTVLTTEQQRQLFVDAFKNTGKSTAAYEDLSNPAWQVNTDWQKLGTRIAARRNYSLAINGGTEKNTYAVSISHLDREGTIKNSDFKSYNLRANNDINIANRLKISTNLAGSHQVQHVLNQDGWGGGAYGSLLSNHTYTEPYDEKGNLTAINTAVDPYFGANSNPLIDLLQPVREQKLTRLLGNVKADVEIAKGLNFTGSLGADLVMANHYTYLPVYQIGIFSRQQGSVTTRSGEDLNWLTDATLQYVKDINRHNLKVLAGFSTQQFNTRFSNTTGTGTLDNALNQLSQSNQLLCYRWKCYSRAGIFLCKDQLWF
jgi:TonB-linked SusC/RagA family outer membrane protein